ncbi:hypothetical protein N7U66_04670 [Lacinutrix neustonica]|uniref:Lipid/polyisoprenoid-binding YceI-like domain-containing protein n=1 Tax=Lacinutrix neustonica TaxID=2980107 RepID=A0A9E8MZ55_9FLAO|nr:hypothetical protein [Lacinutrix neustonica]WAC02925.1 hypothetical protein N7U66_04670 [Lacinutrix neustonica]
MKKNIFALILLFVTFNSFSQDNIGKKSAAKLNYSENSEIKVICNDSLNTFHSKNKPVGIFVNGIFLNENSISAINPDKIETMKVEKESFEKNGKEYFGKILIEMKSDYKPNFISLNELTSKYLTLDTNPIIFQIDENVVNQDYNDYSVDENFILKIELNKIKTSEKDTVINLIKLTSKTPENIKKANEIRIKGTEK